MNTNRIINTDPLEDIDNDDDLLFTNTFVNRVPRVDVTHEQKQNFKRYYEDKKKNLQNKKIIQFVEEEDIYEDYSKFKTKSQEENQKKSDVIDKIKKNTIKTEKVSIISVDSSNRNIYKHPRQNEFELEFRQSFYNIKSIRLLSTTIPNTDQVIKDTPEAIRTDKISWQNLEDLYLGITDNCAAVTNTANTVDLTVVDHGLSTQENIGPLTVWVSGSTTTPSIDGQWSVTIIDSNTLRIPFEDGVSVAGTAKVDTGFPTYTVYLTPGNYNFDTLSAELQRVMNLVKRRKGTGDFHYFTVNISNDTDVVTVRSYIITPLELDSISTVINSSDIVVNSEQHGFKDGDFVLLTGLTATGGLSSSILNGLFVVKEATRSTFKYEVSEKATFSIDGGGNSAKTGKPAEFRFLFDTSESKIVEHIGYPDEDSGVFMNTATDTPLSIYTKIPTNIQLINSTTIQFTSVSHGLELSTLNYIIFSTTGSNPTLTLFANHGLHGKDKIFIYHPSLNPPLNGFYNITVNGSDTFILDDVVVISNGPDLGEAYIGGDSIRLLNLKSVPMINEREFPVTFRTDNTFRINIPEGIVSIDTDIGDIIIQTNKLYVNHPLHGFNELVNIQALPFLESTWTKSTDTGQTMYSIIRGDGLFVSVGRLNGNYRIRISSDGDSWSTSYTSARGTTGQLNSVCYAPSVTALGSTPLYVTVGDNNPGNNLVLTSSSPTVDPNPSPSSWALVNVSFGGVWESVCWSDQLQLFVACGYVSNTQNIMTSPDGASWTLRSNPSGLYNESYKSVTWSPELGIFVAVGYDHTIYSSDGINWNLSNNYPDDYWESVVWSTELELFVAVASQLYVTTESQYAMTSIDGINWIQRDTPSTSYFKSVTWAPELGIFLAVGGASGDGLVTGQFQAGSSTPATLVLDATASTEDDFYNEWDIEITSGPGDDNQRRRIKDYDGTTRIATIYVTADNVGGFTDGLDLVAAPNVGDTYTLYPSNSDSMMTSRNGITWIARSFSPASYLREVCWASDLDIFVSTAVDFNVSPLDYSFLISNISYTDIQCTTLVPHTYTGTRYNDVDLDVYTVIINNADIDIPGHGLQTNDKIIVTDSNTTPGIDGTYFVEVVDSDTVRIPVAIVSPGTCKVRTGDSIIFTGTNSIPSIDGIEATVIGFDPSDPYYLEISIGINVTTPGTTGIIGRRNIVSMHRVEASEPYGDNFAGVPLEIINDTYHQIVKLIDDNNYMIKLNKYALYSYSGGGSGITVSSERNGTRVFQSNTFTFQEAGALFKAISLDGEKYLFLVSPNLQSVISPGNEEIGDIFAKILLTDVPGSIIFDSFIAAPKIFNPPLAVLSNIKLTMKRKDGYLFNFHNTDYSLSLEITEIVDQIKETGLSGRTGSSDIYRNEALKLF